MITRHRRVFAQGRLPRAFLEVVQVTDWKKTWPSLRNYQSVIEGRNGKNAGGGRARLHRVADRVSDELLHCLFHRPRAERLLNASPHQELKAASETVRSMPRSLNRSSSRSIAARPISLCTSGESGLKMIFSSKRPMSSGRKNRCSSEITARSSVVKGRRVGRRSCPLRCCLCRQCRNRRGRRYDGRRALCAPHRASAKEGPRSGDGPFRFRRKAERLADAARERFPIVQTLPVSSPMKSFTLSRCRNSDISKRKNILAAEQIAREFQRQFRLSDSGRS